MKRFKLLPTVMTALSVLYLVYVISSESTTLIADTVGGDPGGKILPITIAIFLIAGFLFISLKEKSEKEKIGKGNFKLYIFTLSLAIMYVIFIKKIGFVLLTTVILFTLEYVYTTIGEKRHPLAGILCGAGTIALTTFFYTLMRLLSKTLIRMGRKGTLPAFFGKNTTVAVICLAYIVFIIYLLSLSLGKLLKKKGLKKEANAGIITLAVVLFLFVVFKQMFLVGLAPGLIDY